MLWQQSCKPDALPDTSVVAAVEQAKQDTAALQEKSKELKAGVLKAEEEAKAADAARDKAIMPIGNLVHDSVPLSNDEVRLAPACTN